MNSENLTLEALEALVITLCDAERAQREKQVRMIEACARIIALREPKQFGRMPLHHGDEAGHWDNSFPPSQVYSDNRGPRLLEVVDCSTEDIATSTGFYHEWRRETSDPGLFVGRDGSLWGCTETGTGAVGQFAAYPGDTGVDCTLEWERLDGDEVSIERLALAVKELSALAFPLATAAQKGAN